MPPFCFLSFGIQSRVRASNLTFSISVQASFLIDIIPFRRHCRPRAEDRFLVQPLRPARPLCQQRTLVPYWRVSQQNWSPPTGRSPPLALRQRPGRYHKIPDDPRLAIISLPLVPHWHVPVHQHPCSPTGGWVNTAGLKPAGGSTAQVSNRRVGQHRRSRTGGQVNTAGLEPAGSYRTGPHWR